MMLKILLSIILLLSWAGVGAAATGAPEQKDEVFTRFYTEFQKAIKDGDKEKVASMTDLDGFTWEMDEKFRQVKNREAFLKSYDVMFTPAIKNRIATGK